MPNAEIRAELRNLVERHDNPDLTTALEAMFAQLDGAVPEILVTIDKGQVKVVSDLKVNITFIRDRIELDPGPYQISHPGAVEQERAWRVKRPVSAAAP